MDRRQQKTRDAIFKAFTYLLSFKSYSKITVQDIIDEANIGRSTFYAHFETKDELLKEFCTVIFRHVFSDTLHSEKTHDFSTAHGDTNALITHILYHLRDNRENIKSLLSSESNELFLSHFRYYLHDLIKLHMFGKMVRKNDTVPEDFLINHISCSFIGMVQWWIQNDMKQTPEELTEYFEAIINPII